MEQIKVVIRYVDGKIIKGHTNDFFPNKPKFHLHPVSSSPAEEGIEVLIKDLKAVFFVHDFEGNPQYNERKEFAEGQKVFGRKVEMTFADGEMLVGTTMGYDPTRPGFFIAPVDPMSNNIKVFVVTAAVKEFRYL